MIKWLKYSGCNITLKLNPFHWRISAVYKKSIEAWEVNHLMIELLMFTVRVWIDDGSW